MRLRTKISIALIITSAIFSILQVFLFYISYLNQFDTANKILKDKNDFIIEKFNTYIRTSSEIVDYFIFHVLKDEETKNIIDKEHILSMFEDFVAASSYINSGFIGLPDGSIIVKPDFDMKPDYNATVRPWYTAAINAQGKTAVSDPYIDYITNDYVISVTKTIIDRSGKFIGVAGTDFKTTFLIDNLISESIYGTVQSFAINSRGIMTIHPEKNLLSTDLSFHEIFEKSSEQEGTFATSFMGTNYFVSYKKIPQINWIFFTATERNNIVRPVLDAFIQNILTFILLQILTIIIIETIVYEASQPFTDLIKSMKNFAQSKDFILDESLKNVKDYEAKNLVKHYSNMAEEIYATLEELRASNEELMSAYESIEQSYDYFSNKMLEIVDGYDQNTGNHIERVGILSEFIATKLGLSIDMCSKIRKYSPLHDIGKISIPQSILLKPGKLEDAEWELMKKHTVSGANIIGENSIFTVARNIALYHHEKYDGTGYPYGLKGDEIPIEATIVTIVDVYDALRSARPYKEAFSHEKAVFIIENGDSKVSPSNFSPSVMDVFKRYKDEIRDLWDISNNS